MKTSIAILKEFFGGGREVTNQELIELAKNDRLGYDELVRLAAVEMGVEIQSKKQP